MAEARSTPAPGADAGPDTVAAADEFDGAALLGQLGSEVASALSFALEQVNTLATTGKIGRRGLRQLRESIERARRAGIMGQQVHRLQAGRVKQGLERVDLTAVVREAIVQHKRELEAKELDIRPALVPAQVMADPSLMFTLLEALLDWATEHARAPIDLRVDLNAWPTFARLSCSFGFLSDEQIDGPLLAVAGDDALRSMSWRLLQQAARTMELRTRLEVDGGRATLRIEFPRTVNDPSEISTPRDRPDPAVQGINSKPLAGSHVLVLSARRETRAMVRDAVRHMGLMLDYVNSLDEAREFCRGGMPHAILHESVLGGERFEKLRAELLAETPHMAFIELAAEGQGLETQKIGGRMFRRISRNAIIEALPPALMFELSRPR